MHGNRDKTRLFAMGLGMVSTRRYYVLQYPVIVHKFDSKSTSYAPRKRTRFADWKRRYIGMARTANVSKRFNDVEIICAYTDTLQ